MTMQGTVRRTASGLLALLLVVGLGGCRSQGEKYCDTLRSDQVRLGEVISSGRTDTLLRGLPLLQQLADQAPDDLSDEWQTLVNAVAGLRTAVGRAGIEAGDLRGGLPASVRGQQRRDLVAAADTLTSANVLSAAQGIEHQAQDVCQVTIGT